MLTTTKEIQAGNQENKNPNIIAKNKPQTEYLKEIEIKIEQLELEYYKKSSSVEIP